MTAADEMPMPRAEHLGTAAPPLQGYGAYADATSSDALHNYSSTGSVRWQAAGAAAPQTHGAPAAVRPATTMLSPDGVFAHAHAPSAHSRSASSTVRISATAVPHAPAAAAPLRPDEELAELADLVAGSAHTLESSELDAVPQLQPAEAVAPGLHQFSDQLFDAGARSNIARPIPRAAPHDADAAAATPTEPSFCGSGGGSGRRVAAAAAAAAAAASAAADVEGHGHGSRGQRYSALRQYDDHEVHSQQQQPPASRQQHYADQSGIPPTTGPRSTGPRSEQSPPSVIAEIRQKHMFGQRHAHHRTGAGTSAGADAFVRESSAEAASPPVVATPAATPSQQRPLELEELRRWQATLERQHALLRERERAAAAAAQEAKEQAAGHEWQTLSGEAKARELAVREARLQGCEERARQAEHGAAAQEAAARRREKDAQALHELLEERLAELRNREGLIEVREQVLGCRERDVIAKRDEIERFERDLEAKAGKVEEAEASLNGWQKELTAQHHSNAARRRELQDDEQRLASVGEELRREQQRVETKVAQLRHLERVNGAAAAAAASAAAAAAAASSSSAAHHHRPQPQPQPQQPPPQAAAAAATGVFDVDESLHACRTQAPPSHGFAGPPRPAAAEGAAHGVSDANNESYISTTRELDLDGTFGSDASEFGGGGGARGARYSGYISPDPEAALRNVASAALHTAPPQAAAPAPGARKAGGPSYISPDPESVRNPGASGAAAASQQAPPPPPPTYEEAAAAAGWAGPPPAPASAAAGTTAAAAAAAAAEAFREQIIKELAEEESEEGEDADKYVCVSLVWVFLFHTPTLAVHRLFEGKLNVDPDVVPSYISEIDSESTCSPNSVERSRKCGKVAPDLSQLPPPKPAQHTTAGGAPATADSSPKLTNNVSTGSVYDID